MRRAGPPCAIAQTVPRGLPSLDAVLRTRPVGLRRRRAVDGIGRGMGLFTLEHSRAAYLADFALYGGAVVILAGLLGWQGPPQQQAQLALVALAGLVSWSGIEYVLHRFVLHGIEPFRRWHAEHHRRPTALICAPTVLSGTLIGTLVCLPAWALGGPWFACALTLGVLAGYLGYAVTHHAMHHWRATGTWLQRRKRWHARHHHDAEPGCYGVTSGFWDRCCGTGDDRPPARHLRPR